MIADAVVIRRVAEPFGFLGNMSPHPVTLRHAHGDLTFRTAEALFQAWRFVGDVRRWPTNDEIVAWEDGFPLASGLFWGARRVGEMKGVGTTWEGKNALGNLWMSVRGELAP